MTDVPSVASSSGPPHRGVGFRFRRPLTQDELDSIVAAAQRRGSVGGLDGAFRATWDILLGEAEGLTMDRAVEQGVKFHPTEYAIPETQAEAVLGIWRRYRGRRYRKESAVGLLWMSMGPGSYAENPPS